MWNAGFACSIIAAYHIVMSTSFKSLFKVIDNNICVSRFKSHAVTHTVQKMAICNTIVCHYRITFAKRSSTSLCSDSILAP